MPESVVQDFDAVILYTLHRSVVLHASRDNDSNFYKSTRRARVILF